MPELKYFESNAYWAIPDLAAIKIILLTINDSEYFQLHGDNEEIRRELDCRVCHALGMNWVDPAFAYAGIPSWRDYVTQFGFKDAWKMDHVFPDLVPSISSSLDVLFAAIYAFLPATDLIELKIDPSGISAEIGRRRPRVWPHDDEEGWEFDTQWQVHQAPNFAMLGAFLKAVIELHS